MPQLCQKSKPKDNTRHKKKNLLASLVTGIILSRALGMVPGGSTRQCRRREKMKANQTINVKKPKAKDFLLTVRLCAETLKPVKKLADRTQREAAERHVDELIAFVEEMAQAGKSATLKTANKEGWALIRRVNDLIQKYNAHNDFICAGQKHGRNEPRLYLGEPCLHVHRCKEKGGGHRQGSRHLCLLGDAMIAFGLDNEIDQARFLYAMADEIEAIKTPERYIELVEAKRELVALHNAASGEARSYFGATIKRVAERLTEYEDADPHKIVNDMLAARGRQ
jgi:hypothetical protein